MDVPQTKAHSFELLDLPYATWDWDCALQSLTGDALWGSFTGKLGDAAAQPGVAWAAFAGEEAPQAFNQRLFDYLRSRDKLHFHLTLVEGEGDPVEYICHGIVVERDEQHVPLRVKGLCRHLFHYEAIPGSADMDGGHFLQEQRKLEALLMKSQRFEGIGKLAGGLAHDLNNLLAPIRMSSEILDRKNKDADLKRFIDIIQSSTDRARGVIEQILNFSRGGDDEERVLMRPLDVLEDLERIVRETFPKSIEAEFVTAEELPRIFIDPTRLHQVLLSLLINARDAIDGQGSIRILAHERRFTLRMHIADKVFHPGRYLCIEVSDTGCGIPEEIRSRIFDPFFTTKEKDKGTGLGLASAYGIVNQSGGFIDVSSELGNGTTFTVYLPEGESEGPVDGKGPGEAQAELKGKRLLLVDDEENILRTMESLLVDLGLKVIAFSDPQAALESVSEGKNPYDMALVDLHMPRMSGEVLVRELQAQNPDVHHVLMTGDLEADGSETAQHLSDVCKLVEKPFLTADLQSALSGDKAGN